MLAKLNPEMCKDAIESHVDRCMENFYVAAGWAEPEPEETDSFPPPPPPESYYHTPETAVRRRLSQRDPDALFTRVHRPRFAALHRELNEKGDGARTVDLVVARHSEDASWLLDVERELPMVRIFVYEKGSGESACSQLGLTAARCTPLANVGREPFTYLTHIIERYDELGDKVVFAQGGAPGYGFLPGKQGGHLMPGSDFFYDYLSPLTPPQVVFTLAYANVADKEVLLGRTGYPYAGLEPMPSKMPTEAPSACAGDWFTINNGTRRFWDDLHKPVPGVDLPDHLAFWKEYAEEELGPLDDAFTPFANGAVLSADGAKLAAHPKSFYEKLRRAVSLTDKSDAIIFTELLLAHITGHAQTAHACSKQIAASLA